MSPVLRVAGEATYRRRRAVVTATVLSSLGVVALAQRESVPHPGRIASPILLGVGLLVYVVPFAFSVDRAMRRGRIRMVSVAFLGGCGGVFLATRPVGSFSQAWPLFTAIVSIIVLRVLGQFPHDGSR